MRDGSGSAPLHGGRLRAARALFADAPDPFLDLSTGINPNPYALPPLPEAILSRLPEPEQELALQAAAAIAYGAPGPAHVAAAPGSQILISLLPTLLGCGRAVVLGPTYAEHARSWRLAGALVREAGTVAELADGAGPGTALVLCNPNNPDGRRLDAAALRDLARHADAAGSVLVVDEAFADLEPDVPQAAALALPGVVALRSFGKTYGLAGLRLGFLLAMPDRAARMRALLGPWSVSGPALWAGLQALPDTGWLHRTRSTLSADAARLDDVLSHAGLRPLGGTCLFRLAGGDASTGARLFDRLGRHGLLVRRFESRPDRLRFGLPPDEVAWSRLERALHG